MKILQRCAKTETGSFEFNQSLQAIPMLKKQKMQKYKFYNNVYANFGKFSKCY